MCKRCNNIPTIENSNQQIKIPPGLIYELKVIERGEQYNLFMLATGHPKYCVHGLPKKNFEGGR